MKKLIFFVIASAILLFSIIIVNIAPAINNLVESDEWSQASCSSISDYIDDQKDQGATDESLKYTKRWLKRCNNKKAMVGLEYVVSNLNIIFGFICALLGFLNFINVGNMGKIIGLIGLGAGVISFVLTLVYVIESGLVFNDVDGTTNNRKESDGAILEWKDNKYVCIYYDKDDTESLNRRYSDYGKKYLNYNKDMNYPEGDKEYMYKLIGNNGCVFSSLSGFTSYNWENCKDLDEKSILSTKYEYKDLSGNKKGECDKILYISLSSLPSDNEKKVIYDRWLTTIIFSCFILLLNIGLAIFGFLLFRESSGSSGSVAIK